MAKFYTSLLCVSVVYYFPSVPEVKYIFVTSCSSHSVDAVRSYATLQSMYEKLGMTNKHVSRKYKCTHAFPAQSCENLRNKTNSSSLTVEFFMPPFAGSTDSTETTPLPIRHRICSFLYFCWHLSNMQHSIEFVLVSDSVSKWCMNWLISVIRPRAVAIEFSFAIYFKDSRTVVG